MESLYNYIVEGRKISELGIGFDLFKSYINSYIMGDELDSMKEIEDIVKETTSHYKSVMKSLKEFSYFFVRVINDCGIFDFDDNILMMLYTKISSMPLNKVDKILGAGEEGMVVELKDKVIKLFYKEQIPNNIKNFFKACKERKYDIFPVVYRIGKGYVVMEKLRMNTPKCQRYDEIIDKIYYDVYDGNYNINDYSKETQEVILWLENIRKAIKDVTDFNDFGDLNCNNFGEREDGTIVYFDI